MEKELKEVKTNEDIEEGLLKIERSKLLLLLPNDISVAPCDW